MLWIKLIIKYCISCWITYILQNDTRSVQYQIKQSSLHICINAYTFGLSCLQTKPSIHLNPEKPTFRWPVGFKCKIIYGIWLSFLLKKWSKPEMNLCISKPQAKEFTQNFLHILHPCLNYILIVHWFQNKKKSVLTAITLKDWRSFIYSGICTDFAPLPLRYLFLEPRLLNFWMCGIQTQDILLRPRAVKPFLSSPLSLAQLLGMYVVGPKTFRPDIQKPS